MVLFHKFEQKVNLHRGLQRKLSIPCCGPRTCSMPGAVVRDPGEPRDSRASGCQRPGVDAELAFFFRLRLTSIFNLKGKSSHDLESTFLKETCKIESSLISIFNCYKMAVLSSAAGIIP